MFATCESFYDQVAECSILASSILKGSPFVAQLAGFDLLFQMLVLAAK